MKLSSEPMLIVRAESVTQPELWRSGVARDRLKDVTTDRNEEFRCWVREKVLGFSRCHDFDSANQAIQLAFEELMHEQPPAPSFPHLILSPPRYSPASDPT